MCDDYEEDPYDYCYECGGYGDNYYLDEDGELICRLFYDLALKKIPINFPNINLLYHCQPPYL